MPDMTPEQIAAGLTKAQRAWVNAGGYCDDKYLHPSERRCLNRLRDARLFEQSGIMDKIDFRLSPLGLAVREHMARTQGFGA